MTHSAPSIPKEVHLHAHLTLPIQVGWVVSPGDKSGLSIMRTQVLPLSVHLLQLASGYFHFYFSFDRACQSFEAILKGCSEFFSRCASILYENYKELQGVWAMGGWNGKWRSAKTEKFQYKVKIRFSGFWHLDIRLGPGQLARLA